jgi:hypothetical protein
MSSRLVDHFAARELLLDVVADDFPCGQGSPPSVRYCMLPGRGTAARTSYNARLEGEATEEEK